MWQSQRSQSFPCEKKLLSLKKCVLHKIIIPSYCRYWNKQMNFLKLVIVCPSYWIKSDEYYDWLKQTRANIIFCKNKRIFTVHSVLWQKLKVSIFLWIIFIWIKLWNQWIFIFMYVLIHVCLLYVSICTYHYTEYIIMHSTKNKWFHFYIFPYTCHVQNQCNFIRIYVSWDRYFHATSWYGHQYTMTEWNTSATKTHMWQAWMVFKQSRK